MHARHTVPDLLLHALKRLTPLKAETASDAGDPGCLKGFNQLIDRKKESHDQLMRESLHSDGSNLEIPTHLLSGGFQ
ncbi:uncharacterized protein VTP21DRAFT_7150 [Calcarisporiella thermophila]|uniref:uncharacterized protein n=1 Tax=Calcarisporiella thermophila TaxID=911321 RepID=UPI003743C2F5